MRMFAGLSAVVVAAGLCSGCADQPKPGGVKTVSPAIPAKPADKPADKPAAPPAGGSTTGGGTETPAAPKDGG